MTIKTIHQGDPPPPPPPPPPLPLAVVVTSKLIFYIYIRPKCSNKYKHMYTRGCAIE